MKQLKLNSLLAAAAFSLASVFAVQANAEQLQQDLLLENTADMQSISVTYAGGELTTDEGRASLYAKIRRAAEKVCGPTNYRQAGSLRVASQNRKCYEEALSAAVSQVESTQLVSLAN